MVRPHGAAPASAGGAAPLWQQFAGDYDNHAQVWTAAHAKSALPPQHFEHHIIAVHGSENQWNWAVTMPRPDGKTLHATWRYRLRTLASGQQMLVPQRALPVAAGASPRWATLTPCALIGGERAGRLSMRANIAACSAILPGLGAAGALLPVRFNFDGDVLRVATFADQARGPDAVEQARRVRWFSGWVVINGGGPDAQADNHDWHAHRDLRIGDEGGHTPILWRDGSPSGYSLRLERLSYQKRGIRVLQLSLIRDSDGGTVAYAWANPQATRIGLNLGWVQTGLSLESIPKKP